MSLLPKISIDATFKNVGDKNINSIVFEFLFYSKNGGGVEATLIQPKSLLDKTPILSNETSSLLYELSSELRAFSAWVSIRHQKKSSLLMVQRAFL